MSVDLERIKMDINLVQYIERAVGVPAKKVGADTWRFNPCPSCGGRDHFTVSFKGDKWFYHSFAECVKGGSVIDFVQEFEGAQDFKSVIEHLANQFAWIETAATADNQTKPAQRKQQNTLARQKQPEPEVLPLPDLKAEFEQLHAGTINDSYNYFDSRGLSKEIQQEYLLCSHADGLNYFIRKLGMAFVENTSDFSKLYKHMVPNFDLDGKITYFFPHVDKESVDKSSLPDNLKEVAKKTKMKKLKDRESRFFNDRYLLDPKLAKNYIFITEGIFDALSIESIGYQSIALNGVNNASKLADMIKENKHKYKDIIFVLALDNDDAGRSAYSKLVERFKADGINYDQFEFDQEYKDVNDLLQADKARLIQCLEEFEQQREERELKQLHNATTLIDNFIAEINKNRNTPGTHTGFSILDQKLGGGLFPGLYTLGAISSLGKTTLALQIADNVAASGQDVIFFSLEMSANEVIAKSFSRIAVEIAEENQDSTSIYSTRDILNGIPQIDEYEEMEKRYMPIAQNMFIVQGDFNADLSMIKRTIDQHVRIRKTKPVVFIDYLQILLPESDRLSDKQAVDRNVVGLKRISREFDLPVILVSSFNRQSYHTPVSYSSFKESGAIEYSSDVIMGLQLFVVNDLDNVDDKETAINEAKTKIPREVELIILKNRNGNAYDRMLFKFYPRSNRFEQTEYNELQKSALGIVDLPTVGVPR